MFPQKLREKPKDANPSENFCAPHILSTAGKQATVLLFVKCEQYCQISTHGPKNFTEEVLPV